ncbi:hypothetical protein BOTBODRAFT_585518 [Botryobasidium botryosum FD-172 SS1]|uniref:Uncharacterized protein n=1 Tax=Botryobasidium botryosum (strain FD-172 SS1) TaxID=930990 RepID=A0A067LXA6_BOTB1|nr:hypothetical protein BOTBODRAFT_585518 [Botryobasidium botryosum FD-172 SS1]
MTLSRLQSMRRNGTSLSQLFFFYKYLERPLKGNHAYFPFHVRLISIKSGCRPLLLTSVLLALHMRTTYESQADKEGSRPHVLLLLSYTRCCYLYSLPAPLPTCRMCASFTGTQVGW